MNTEDSGKLVAALVRGISVLQCFSNKHQELSARELMDMTGLPKPTLFRLIDTLCELNLMRYSERLSKYVPGVGLLNLSSPVLARMHMRQFARPHMQELANHLEGQIQLAVPHGQLDLALQGIGQLLHVRPREQGLPPRHRRAHLPLPH